jgi:[CysO sulfur-carrier protein]-S-L-cysteine hydrolase
VSEPVRVFSTVASQLLAYAAETRHEECCGLLAGRDGVIAGAFPATNIAANRATSYEIAPEELFRLMREFRVAGLSMMGVYHSHPNSKNEPSPRDVALAYFPDVAYFIISPQPHAPNPIRAFSIRGNGFAELQIQVVP